MHCSQGNHTMSFLKLKNKLSVLERCAKAQILRLQNLL